MCTCYFFSVWSYDSDACKNKIQQVSVSQKNIFAKSMEKDFEIAKGGEKAISSLNEGQKNYYRGIKAFQTRDFEKALSYFQKAVENLPQEALSGILYYRALVSINLQKFDDVVLNVNKLLDLYPNEGINYVLLGHIHGFLADHNKAIIFYTKAIERGFDKSDIFFARGNEKLRNGELQHAVLDLQKAAELASTNSLYYNVLGRTFNSLNDNKSAIDAFTKAVDIKPSNPLFLYNRAVARFNIGDYQKSISDLNKAVFLKPDLGDAYYIRGQIFSFMGKYDFSISNYNKALSLNLPGPLTTLIHYSRGLDYRHLKELRKAISDFEKAKEKGRVENYHLYSWALASAHQALGEHDKAVFYFDQALNLDSENAYLYEGLARSYKALGRKSEAKDHLRQARKLDPKIHLKN